jgi:sensor c-di-GMP phosphodiesterase-like protein
MIAALRRRGRIVVGAFAAALLGSAILLAATAWFLWQQSVADEATYSRNLAATLGRRSENIIVDTRDLLARLDKLAMPRCSKEHLQALQDAAISRPYIRGIGYWRATERVCGIGFLPDGGLKPAHADRVYDTGVVAWWPSPQTEVGGVQLFLMRYGDHDVAIDPRMLLDLGPMNDRQAVLWVESLRMSAIPWTATLPVPGTLPIGVTIDRKHGRVLSHYARNTVMPIDVVAMEPIDNFWARHAQTLAIGAGIALLLIVAWIDLILRYSRNRLGMAAALRLALAKGQIRVHYQPVIDLANGRCVGSEALARWTLGNGDVVSPDVFIPVAEQAGLVQEVTLSVLRNVVREMKPVFAEFPGTSVNLNLSSDDLKNGRTGQELAKILASEGLSPGTIKLEITERALLNTDISRAMIHAFRDIGHQIAVDDFGTGYSSLSYLQSFELDVLKIDKSFVDAIGTEAATSHVIVHVIEMAKGLRLITVAEGVETREQMQWLVEHGVDFGQGYLFSKPIPAGEFHEFLRNNRRQPATHSR